MYRNPNDARQLPQIAASPASKPPPQHTIQRARVQLPVLPICVQLPCAAAAGAIWSGPCLELGSVAIAPSVIRRSLVTPRLSCVSTLFDCPSRRPSPAAPASACASACRPLCLRLDTAAAAVGCSTLSPPSPHRTSASGTTPPPPAEAAAAPCCYGCCLSRTTSPKPPAWTRLLRDIFGQSRPKPDPSVPVMATIRTRLFPPQR
jgi:hypothetical protein